MKLKQYTQNRSLIRCSTRKQIIFDKNFLGIFFIEIEDVHHIHVVKYKGEEDTLTSSWLVPVNLNSWAVEYEAS